MKASFFRSKFTSFLMILCCAQVVLPDLYGQGAGEDVFKNLTYRNIGPTRQSGRFVDFAVPLQQPYTFYVATGSGGLWKTENNGLTYTPIFDHENSIAIGDIAVALSDPDIVWVGTGEANGDYWGDGIYKSTDGGKTFTRVGLEDSHHIARVITHPEDPDIVYAAAQGHLWGYTGQRGLYKTTDGGETWLKLGNGLPSSGSPSPNFIQVSPPSVVL